MAAMKTRSRRSSGNYEERDAKREERVTALKEKFDAAVSELASSDAWTEMLKGAVRLHRYSFRNMMLILQQCPHASQVAGYRAWQASGRNVRKGERAIWILAPMTARKDADSEQDSSETDGGKDRRRTFFRPVKVFDISQTERVDGHVDPTSRPKLTGDAPAHMWERLAEYAVSLGYSVERGPVDPGNGYTEIATRTVRVGSSLEAAHAAKTLAHEVAHIVCEHVADYAEYERHRGLMETEAESVAFIVAGVFGLNASVVSVPYVAGWAGRTPEEVRETIKTAGSRVTSAAKIILAAVAPVDGMDADPDHRPGAQAELSQPA
ncbi:ArdC-like ssDNA-binding domain-containing protein [Streptomyces sp. NBC_01619]|uniref:ArdC family protein n=1 Tax=Streptomyces sp. NBC_01619 TaxID=2975901 RepID=UPI002251E28A|nr:ArdC family protein [Streptomyces sp. NBC_01619]MCX4515896.1 ArdC-like ssDNA-binding domain-containing protein [Streptomyces sp. NBC_01619]